MGTILLSLRLAWVALLQNKVRSILTLMGMIIGVGAVIAIVSLGEGLRNDFQSQISALGSDVFYMTPRSPKRPGQARKMPELFKMADMRAIEEQCPAVKQVVPSVDVGVTAKNRDRTKQSHILGVYEDYLESDQTNKLEKGRFFTKAERMSHARVVVIGSDITNDLYEKWEEPVDKTVKLNGVTYHVIGRLANRSGVMAGGPGVNDGFIAPITPRTAR